MSNRTFNERVVPQLQPDRDAPGATVDRSQRLVGAMTPRRRNPLDTGFFPQGGRTTPAVPSAKDIVTS